MKKGDTLQQDFRESLTAKPLHIVCRSEYAFFRTSLPCLNILSASPLLPYMHMILDPIPPRLQLPHQNLHLPQPRAQHPQTPHYH